MHGVQFRIRSTRSFRITFPARGKVISGKSTKKGKRNLQTKTFFFRRWIFEIPSHFRSHSHGFILGRIKSLDAEYYEHFFDDYDKKIFLIIHQVSTLFH